MVCSVIATPQTIPLLACWCRRKKKPIEITFDQSSNYWRYDGTLWVPVDECGYRHDRTEVLVVRKLKTRVIPNSHDLSSHPVVIVNNTHAVFIQFSLLFNLNEEKPIFKKNQFFQSLKQIYCCFFLLVHVKCELIWGI